MWFDSHCHPYFDSFDDDREEMIQRAKAAGVSQMLVVGCDKESNRKALELAKQHEGMWVSLGVHPCDLKSWNEEEAAWIKNTVQFEPKVRALGEMGLDYYHKDFSPSEQDPVFRAQIQLAKELDLPCIVHSRDAAEDTLKVLIEEEAKQVVFHCYSYDLDFAKRVWERGFYTSFSGTVTYPKSEALREVAKNAPDDLILIETDAPFLSPQNHRGQRNEVAYVSEIGEFLAKIREMNIEDFALQIKNNAETLFKILDPQLLTKDFQVS